MVDVVGLNILSQALYNARKNWAEKNNIQFANNLEEYKITPEEREIINLIEKELELKLLNYGASRIVFQTPDKKHAYKLARYGNNHRIHDGKKQNEREAAIWRKIIKNNDQEEIPVIPIREYNEEHYWIKEPYVEPLNKTNLTEQKKKQINHKVEKETRRLSSIVSIFDTIGKNSNIGIDDNQDYYLIDYGLEPDYEVKN